MIAGRDGREIHTVQTNMTLGDGEAAFGAAADDAGQSGPLLADYLRRGHALACAAGVDLEQPLASWSSVEQDVEGRAWRSFGRLLAQSHPEDWRCLTVPSEGHVITKLYVKLDKGAWWSFQTLLERPSVEAVDSEQAMLDQSRSKAESMPSLKGVAALLHGAEGPALRRAARAIRARVGEPIARTRAGLSRAV
jgi:hypothetical protein